MYFLVILALLMLYMLSIHIQTNIIFFLILMRGVLSPDCFWWKMNDLYGDVSGINLYYGLKKDYKFFQTYFGKTKSIVVLDVDFMKNMLENSPAIFGVGKVKYNFFKTFMEHNVGVSNGACRDCPWRRRREYNEKVLHTGKIHPLIPLYDSLIRRELKKKLPTNHQEFKRFAKKMTTAIVFGESAVIDSVVFDVFAAADKAYFGNMFKKLPDRLWKRYSDSLYKQIDNPANQSLIAQTDSLTKEEIMHQIPHWIFPINGIFLNMLPKLLTLLINHPEKIKKINEKGYLRKCGLELFRLNNPVNSTFRTLLKDYKGFKKGEQFVILNNAVLRDPTVFKKPHEFRPERWTSELERSYYSIVFNYGPQMCPGKELALSLLSSATRNYLSFINHKKIESIKLNTEYIDQQINPCKLRFSLSN